MARISGSHAVTRVAIATSVVGCSTLREGLSQVEVGDGGRSDAAHPDPVAVLHDAGGRPERRVPLAQLGEHAAVVGVEGEHPHQRLGVGQQAVGQAATAAFAAQAPWAPAAPPLRCARTPSPPRSGRRVRSRCCPGTRAGRRPTASPCPRPVRSASTSTARAPDVSANTSADSSAVSVTPLAKYNPAARVGDGAVGVAPEQRTRSAGLEEGALVVLVVEPIGRLGEIQCPVGGFDDVRAELQRADPSTSATRVSNSPVPVSMRSSPRWLSQISSRPSRATASPSGRPPVSATTVVRPGLRVDPHDLAVGQRRSRRRRRRRRRRPRGRGPGRTTIRSRRSRSGVGSGRDGGGRQRTGSIGGFGSAVTRARLPVVSEEPAGFAQHAVQDVVDRVELLLPADQRGSQLHDWVAAVVGAAVQPGLPQRGGQEAAQQPLGLLVVEGLLGGLVLDQLDAVEEALAADVADDRQVVELLQRRPERRAPSP